MALIAQSKGSLHGGVNEQDATFRLSHQVEEMNNCVPTIDRGLHLRNASFPILLQNPDGVLTEPTFPDDWDAIYSYHYDRGIFDDRASELVFLVSRDGGLEIIDLRLTETTDANGNPVLAGTIYRDGAGINYQDDNARAYLARYASRQSFSMTTVKDTTFVTNKTFLPEMLPTYDLPDDPDLPPSLVRGNVTIDYDAVTGLNPETVSGGSGSFTFTAPESVITATLCGVAGGGGGGGHSIASGGAAGGYAGETTPAGTSIDTTNPIAITIGTGGGGTTSNSVGGAGTNTVIGATTLLGGAGGAIGTGSNYSGNYAGNGAFKSTCGGENYDGLRVKENDYGTGWGGQSSGFGKGGNGDAKSYGDGGGTAEGGGIGAGGGGADTITSDSVKHSSGKGGAGQVRFSWDIALDPTNTDYLRRGYVWIKRTDPVYGWRYSAVIHIRKADGSRDVLTSNYTPDITGDTIEAAQALQTVLASLIGSRGTAIAFGSMVRVELATGGGEEIITVEAQDSYGDTASFGWGHRVDYPTDLPSNMADFSPIVEVGETNKPSYWLRYNDGRWQETIKPLTYTALNANTMPHQIQRRKNTTTGHYEFYVERYAWDYRRAGDDKTNKEPSFIGKPIKDLLFFKNRLVLVTSDSIALSEVGEYGQFFRTSVAAVLDSDRIDAGVESINAVDVEHALVLEDSIILFSEKAQFRFKGGNILSPNSYELRQELSYEVNTEVKPIFMNDRIFFVASRGRNSAVYDLRISNNSDINSNATDLTAHCQTYVDANVDKLSGSAVNSMLFLTSRVDYRGEGFVPKRDTVFVYKYYDEGNTRLQSAWSKWTFNGNIFAGFAISKNFYMMINRENLIAASDWIMGSGRWDMTKQWKNLPWVMNPNSLNRHKQFERVEIFPKDSIGWHLDNYNTTIEGYVAFGEWIYGQEGNRNMRGNLLMRTVEIRAEGDIKLWVEDLQRNSYREIPSNYLLRDKVMMYGNAKDVRIGIKNDGIKGFRLDVVSFEGTLARRQSTRSV